MPKPKPEQTERDRGDAFAFLWRRKWIGIMEQPVDHILRPQLPWRSEPGITECGLDASKISTLTRADYFQRVKDLGKQRSAMLTCMTCSDAAVRWCRWDDDPRKALERAIAWECGWGKNRGVLLLDELLAIAALIKAHREEFDMLVASHQQRRDWLQKKAALEKRPKVAGAPPRSLL